MSVYALSTYELSVVWAHCVWAKYVIGRSCVATLTVALDDGDDRCQRLATSAMAFSSSTETVNTPTDAWKTAARLLSY